jgi:hypothetical protein
MCSAPKVISSTVAAEWCPPAEDLLLVFHVCSHAPSSSASAGRLRGGTTSGTRSRVDLQRSVIDLQLAAAGEAVPYRPTSKNFSMFRTCSRASWCGRWRCRREGDQLERILLAQMVRHRTAHGPEKVPRVENVQRRVK